MTRFLPFRLDRCRYALLFGLILGAGIVATPSPAAAVEWHHQHCPELVHEMTKLKEIEIAYSMANPIWMRYQAYKASVFNRRCGVTCHDAGDWWHAWALRDQKKVRQIRKRNEKFADDFQSWIDFMDKCLKSVEKGNAGALKRQTLVNGFTLLHDEILSDHRWRADTIQKRVVDAEFRWAKNCQVRCGDTEGDFKKITGVFLHISMFWEPRTAKFAIAFSSLISNLDTYMKSLES